MTDEELWEEVDRRLRVHPCCAVRRLCVVVCLWLMTGVGMVELWWSLNG